MKYASLIKATITSMQLNYQPKGRRIVYTYCTKSKRRFLSKLRTYKKGKYMVLVRYRGKGNYRNESVWYSSKRELVRALNAFTERPLLEEFLA